VTAPSAIQEAPETIDHARRLAVVDEAVRVQARPAAGGGAHSPRLEGAGTSDHGPAALGAQGRTGEQDPESPSRLTFGSS
jgi:hypothetical protein